MATGRWRQALGRAAEDLAARHLESEGCQILARRFRWRRGEVDLVVRDGDTLAFVEVKARRGRRYGTPVEAVTDRKVRRLRATARRFLRSRGYRDVPVRFDVVAVRVGRGRARIRWITGAF